ncbi:MAG: 7-cyano-7-deazaguanine tRNA-ribosyltransferase [Candidatus Aramenus sulfurataquae]|jgi:7-cyano-7-deazaguanine tRNA-ribosyltransferase|uniref:tRNA-guanine(15) transglycosylase n=1 Tax=Candidatus Aramenus sulfurataquae TaxID=1326980 RepID=W7KVI0_9CREN|nr:MAG: 7-cyano-7-deazaguanine tRNA-ribosyltransferase [Candidatus Aramenus sulfurataquae]
MIGDFEVKDEDLAGRIGSLETRSQRLESPIFFPVVNPLKPEVSVEDLKKLGLKQFITNSYILYKNKLVNEDIHKELNFEGSVMTDSGAYQILQYGSVEITNREVVEYQLKIRPDIAVFLDLPTGNTESYEDAKITVEETIKRGKEALELISSSNDIVWVHPIQGGRFLDLLSYSAKFVDKTPYKFLALGSPTVVMQEYDYVTLIDMVFTVRSSISRGKPLHLFGGGLPQIIPFVVALGVDSFDSASYIIYARDNRYITRSRTYRLEEMDYFPCSCPVCSRYTPKELMEMDKKERTRLLAIHNLYKIIEEINETKLAIRENRLFEYLQEKSYAHPSVYSAFRRVLKYAEYLEKYDPRVKGEIRGMFLYDENSLHRPEMLRHKRFLESVTSKHSKAIIICGDNLSVPFINDPKVRSVLQRHYQDSDVYIAIPFYGLIPALISESYPLAQFELPSEVSEGVITETLNVIKKFLVSKKYDKVEFIECENSKLSHVMSI